MTQKHITNLNNIKSLESEISSMRLQEKIIDERLLQLEKSMAYLTAALNQKTLQLDKQEVKKLEESAVIVTSLYRSMHKVAKPPKEELNISKMIKSRALSDPNAVEDELTQLRIQESNHDQVLNANMYVLNAFDQQYRKITKQRVTLPDIVADLKYSLEEAENMGLIDQNLLQSRQNFGGKVEVVEVEDLFECDGVEVV